MPITFNCPCGKVLRIADEHAGKRIKCPACQALGTAPSAAPQFEVIDEPNEQLAPAPKPTAKPVAKPASKPARDEDDDPGFTVEEDEKPKKKPSFSKGSRRDEDEDEDERPRKKKKRRREDDDDDEYDHDRPRRRPPARSDAGKKVLYLIGGLLLVCAGAALAYFGWQGQGRGATKAVVFGICLVVGGLGTSVKGITGNFDDDE